MTPVIDGKGRDIVPHCRVHEDRASAAACRRCGVECCDSCLVFSFGEGKAPFCPACALAVAGLEVAIGSPVDGIAGGSSRLAVG